MTTTSLKSAVTCNQTDREIHDGDYVVKDTGGCVLAVEKSLESANAKADEIESEFGRECLVLHVVEE